MIRYRYRCRVYYRDVDQMGIVYYTRYLEYFEAARTEMLASIGLDVTTLERSGVYLPVITAYCEYKSGARFEDTLEVETVIRERPRLKLRIDYLVRRQDSPTVLVAGYTVHAFIKKETGKPTRPPAKVRAILDPYFG
jgi:acyl-CoA thioester hydrolase